MNKHLSFRSGNPALSANTFKNVAESTDTSGRMTLEGTINKSTISLLILLLTSFYIFKTQNYNFIWIGFIGGFIMALITIFKK